MLQCLLTFSHCYNISIFNHAGDPRAISAMPLSMSTCMECAVIIPSNLRISAIGSQMVTWSVAKKGEITVLQDTVTDADHNLILVNPQKTDEGTYYATGSNSEGSENGASVTLAVAEEPGEYIYIYIYIFRNYGRD